MTITRTIRYLCAHEEAVRLSGARVGVLPASYTIAVPFECGGCRVCDPTPWLLNCGHHRSDLVAFEDGTAVCAACAEQAPSVRRRNDETPRPGAAGRAETETGVGARQEASGA